MVLHPHTPRLWDRRPMRVLVALVAPLAAALVLTPFRTTLANSAAALVLAAVICAVAVTGDRVAGYLATVSSAVFFDLFLTRPYESLSITSAHDIETFVALAVVGAVVTEIGCQSRRHYAIAATEGEYLAVIHDLSDLVASGAPLPVVIETAEAALRDLLDLRRCQFERGRDRGSRPRLERTGEVEAGDVRFDVDHAGLPDGEVELAAESAGQLYGLFVMEAAHHQAISIEQRVVALAIASQVGAALAAHPEAA